jgi:hypothetical protein
MKFDFGFITEHPYAIGGTVLVGGVLLYLYWKGGTTSAAPVTTVVSSGTSTDMQLAAIQAGTALQTAQIQGQAAVAQINAQTQSDALAAQTEITLAQINAQASTTQQVNAITGSTNIAGINANVQSQQIQATRDVQSKQISSQTQIASQGIAAQIEQQKLVDELSSHVADNAAAIQLSQIQAQYGTQAGVLDLLKNGALGNTNRAAVATALLGQGGASQAIANAGVASSPAAIIGSIGSAVSGALGRIFA